MILCLCAYYSKQELEEMLKDFNNESKVIGRNINIDQTMFITNDENRYSDTILKTENAQITKTDSYIFLGQKFLKFIEKGGFIKKHIISLVSV